MKWVNECRTRYNEIEWKAQIRTKCDIKVKNIKSKIFYITIGCPPLGCIVCPIGFLYIGIFRFFAYIPCKYGDQYEKEYRILRDLQDWTNFRMDEEIYSHPDVYPNSNLNRKLIGNRELIKKYLDEVMENGGWKNITNVNKLFVDAQAAGTRKLDQS
jgi:hypothetical protein